MPASTDKYNGVILTGATTYPLWVVDATHSLMSSGVTCVLQELPTATAQQLAHARVILIATVDRLSGLQFFRGNTSPREAWLNIAAKYGGADAADAAKCYEELNALRYTSNPREFPVSFYSLVERLETRNGRPIDDQEGRALLLRTLPNTVEWNIWASTQRSRNDQDLFALTSLFEDEWSC